MNGTWITATIMNPHSVRKSYYSADIASTWDRDGGLPGRPLNRGVDFGAGAPVGRGGHGVFHLPGQVELRPFAGLGHGSLTALDSLLCHLLQERELFHIFTDGLEMGSLHRDPPRSPLPVFVAWAGTTRSSGRHDQHWRIDESKANVCIARSTEHALNPRHFHARWSRTGRR